MADVRTSRQLSSETLSTVDADQAQLKWAKVSVQERLKILRRARHLIAANSANFAHAISPDVARTPADTRVSEILPLLAACRFLERNAVKTLAPKKLGRRGLPLWLAGLNNEIQRVPLGHVLVIGPSNYPLFLPAVQALQALAAGNSVTWKPGQGGRRVAALFAEVMSAAGLPAGLLRVTDESVEAVQSALAQAPAKVFFTGSAETGRKLMRQMAETLTPCVMELSGCDAVIVLPSADLDRVVKALVFGMRLNGSATCMAPRRILMLEAGDDRIQALLTRLIPALQDVPPIAISDRVQQQLRLLLNDAVQSGAQIYGEPDQHHMRPLVVANVLPSMKLAQADLFAPVLSIIDTASEAALLESQALCPFALTAAIFGDESEARHLAARMTVGGVLINDLIVPTADPRLPFGGRRQSGFGVTRGAEGLLEMTAVKTIAVRRGTSSRHYEPTTATHETLFDGLIAAAHAATWSERWRGVKQTVSAGRKLAEKR